MDFSVTAPIVWGTIAVAGGLFIVASSILSYHWRAYGAGHRYIKGAQRLYYMGALLLFAALVLLATLIV